MMNRLISVPLLTMVVFGPLPGEAATISASKQGYISIVGPIVPGDELAFADELKTFTPARPAEVRLDSPGGSVVTGLAIAEIVHVGGQYSKVCFAGGDCVHQTEALTPNRKYSYAVRSNPRIEEKAFCVTSFERARKACYTEGSGEVLFLHSSRGKWKKVAPPTALTMID